MTNERKLEMFDELLVYVTEVCSPSDAPFTLHGIGFTADEIKEILSDT